ncbi:interleukin-17F isoform X2 [Lagenorhynchus albirostris]|uniref:interleukin-17F isoform X2 n=1 Tax=Lagenorhynchus albirostris TaxID=27610 RepID=UPI0028E612F2|nr:interleukin-17F isoform X2 [Lagenorhynchus albirostris]XP_060019058.1 interleukin-17F isoform X2 [Lagenorhynchus albirostris]
MGTQKATQHRKSFLHETGDQSKVTMTFLRDVAMVKSLLLLTLGLTLLGEVAGRKTPKAGDPALCPPPEDHTVRVDIRILRQNQGIPLSHGLQNRSSTPWDYNVTRDPHRYPSEIAEARCRHTGCLNAEGKEDSSMNSVPIQQEFLVLRRESQGCSRSFRLEKVRVTVGCTCVTPIVRYVRGLRAADQLS